MIQDLKEHLELIKPMLKVLVNDPSTKLNLEYHQRLIKFLNKFHYWRPEIFVHVENGQVSMIFANTDTILNLWDDDDEKETPVDDTGITYQERRDEWHRMIESSIRDNEIKQIY